MFIIQVHYSAAQPEAPESTSTSRNPTGSTRHFHCIRAYYKMACTTLNSQQLLCLHSYHITHLASMSAKVVALAGANGYVGKAFADAFLNTKGFQLRILARPSSVSRPVPAPQQVV